MNDEHSAWVEYEGLPPDGEYLWRMDEDDDMPDFVDVINGEAFCNGKRRIISGGQWRGDA